MNNTLKLKNGYIFKGNTVFILLNCVKTHRQTDLKVSHRFLNILIHTESVSSGVSRPPCRSWWWRVFSGRGAAGSRRWRWGGWGLSTTRKCTASWTAAGSSQRSSSCGWSCSSGTCGRRSSPLWDLRPASAKHRQIKILMTSTVIIRNTTPFPNTLGCCVKHK